MTRRSLNFPQNGPDWFLPEWMATLHMTQAAMVRETGWSKATVNDIYHGRTAYYRQILNEAAMALKIAPHELLMLPEDAMAMRSFRESARLIAAEPRQSFHHEEEGDRDIVRRRK